MKISMPRGDIRNIKFSIKDSNGEVVDTDFDEIYFTCKRTFNDSSFLFQKRLSNGTITKDENNAYHLSIMSEDTSHLSYGDYVFDIELVLRDQIKETTVGKLILTGEVTHAGNEG